MRVFSSTVEAVKEIERDLWEMGHKNTTKSMQDKQGEFETREMIGYSFALLSNHDWEASFDALGMPDYFQCIEYVKLESMARLTIDPTERPNPGISWQSRSEVWKKFLEPQGSFSYTYPERICRIYAGNYSQLDQVTELHDKDSASRHLLINIYDPNLDHENRGGRRRVPCTMHYQLLDRENGVTLIVVMRSLDLYTHLAIDLSIASIIAKSYAKIWGDKPCQVIFQIGSLHAYESDMKLRKIF